MRERSATLNATRWIGYDLPVDADTLQWYRTLLDPASLVEAKKKCDEHPQKIFFGVRFKNGPNCMYLFVCPWDFGTTLFAFQPKVASYIPVAIVTEEGLLKELPKEANL